MTVECTATGSHAVSNTAVEGLGNTCSCQGSTLTIPCRGDDENTLRCQELGDVVPNTLVGCKSQGEFTHQVVRQACLEFRGSSIGKM